MRIRDMVNRVNRYLAGEMEDYNNLIDLMDAVIDDVNAKLNTCFPVISEWAKFVEEYNDKVRENLPTIKTTEIYEYAFVAHPEEVGDTEDVGDVDTDPVEPIPDPTLDELLEQVPVAVRSRDKYRYITDTFMISKSITKELVKEPEAYVNTKTTRLDPEFGLVHVETFISFNTDPKELLDPLDYTAIPDKYLRTLIIGVAYKYYIRDEEGEKVASEYWQNYQQALFEILRDYDQYVPDVFRSHRKGYITGHGGEMNDPFCRFYNIFR